MTIEEARYKLYEEVLWHRHDDIAEINNLYRVNMHWRDWVKFIREGGLDDIFIKIYKL